MIRCTILSQVVYTDVALDPYNSLGASVGVGWVVDQADWLGLVGWLMRLIGWLVGLVCFVWLVHQPKYHPKAAPNSGGGLRARLGVLMAHLECHCFQFGLPYSGSIHWSKWSSHLVKLFKSTASPTLGSMHTDIHI